MGLDVPDAALRRRAVLNGPRLNDAIRAREIRLIDEKGQNVGIVSKLDAMTRATEAGLDVVDNPANKEYPLPLYVAEKYNCEVGRLRKDCALDNGLCFWVAGDQLLKGAALNAVQIAEVLLK